MGEASMYTSLVEWVGTELRLTCLAWDSASQFFERWVIWWMASTGWLSCTRLCLFHTDQTITANNSSSYMCLIIHDKSSLKVKNYMSPLKLHCSESAQTKSSSEHNHNACSEFSVVARHLTHKSSSIILCQNRECFVGMASRHALHSNVFTFCGMFMDQICFQTCVSSFVAESWALFISSSSILKNLYPDLQLYSSLLE